MSWDIEVKVNGEILENASWNYTHNCNEMMRMAGYDWIYHLDNQLVLNTIPKFQMMVDNLKLEPEKYRSMNPINGWGDYDELLDMWELEILPRIKEIVIKYPNAVWAECS